LDVDQTRIMTAADRAESALDRALHSLELIDGLYLGRRYLIARGGATLGRSAPADIVLPESEVSRAHCRVTVEGEDLVVTDLDSTNGTYIDGIRVTEPTVLPVGAVLTVGRQALRRLGGEDASAPVAAPDIFLSYNREDQAVARRFAEAFSALGFNVWWDVTLRAGQAYDEVTEAALRSARAVVVLWSKRSVASRWVRAEATLGDRNGTLLPAMIETCERPVMFELTQTANLSHWQGEPDDAAWLAFVEDVRRRIDASGSSTDSSR
jgi:pSer/pThr/pTyr-binding forkhead associated (FHA) protein